MRDFGMRSRSRVTGSRALVLGLLIYLGSYFSWYVLGSSDVAVRATVTDATYLPLNVGSIVLALWAARSTRLPATVRRVWFWVALACVARFVGDGLWFWLEGIRHVDPFPSSADFGYVAFYPLILTALLLVPTQTRIGRDRTRLVCELLAIVGAGWMALWFLVIGPATAAGVGLDLGGALSLGYPLADLGLLAVVASVAIRRPARDARALFIPLALAMTCLIVADTSFSLFSLHGTWRGGQISDVFWLSALALMVYAPVRQMEVAARQDLGQEPSSAMAEPGVGTAVYTYGAVLVGAALLWWTAWGRPFSELGGLLVGLTLVLAGVLVRQVVAVQDADRTTLALAEQQAALELERSALATALKTNVELSAGLELTVGERTAELAARTQELHRQAYLDALTGLGNRLMLRERLESVAVARAGSLSLLMVDLDGFKEVNDSLGHSTGDALLVAVAERLQAAAGGELVVRLGGDEFAVLLSAPLIDAELLGQRLVDVLAPAFEVCGARLTIGASVGVTSSGGGSADPEVLLRDADCAMYHAKRARKGRVASYEQGMHEQVADRLRLQGELRQAVGTSQLYLEYQPLVRLADGSTLGAEALVRWLHPSRGPLPPLNFISLAEDSGLIVQLGRQVLAEACLAASRWQERPGGRGVQ